MLDDHNFCELRSSQSMTEIALAKLCHSADHSCCHMQERTSLIVILRARAYPPTAAAARAGREVPDTRNCAVALLSATLFPCAKQLHDFFLWETETRSNILRTIDFHSSSQRKGNYYLYRFYMGLPVSRLCK